MWFVAKKTFLPIVVVIVALAGISHGQSNNASSSATTMVVESSGSCVDVYGGSSQAGGGIDQWTCNGYSNQSFLFTAAANGYYTIQAQNDYLCLDAGTGSVTTGVQVVQNVCTGSNSQQWVVTRNGDGSYTITTTNGMGCLDVYGGSSANGTKVTTWACHGSNNESFFMASFLPGTPLSTNTTPQTSGSTMVPESSSGSCVDVYGGSSQSGAGIDQWACDGYSNQSFLFTPVSTGRYTIQPQNDNLCLDAGSGSTTTGVQVVQNVCSGTSSQQWVVNRNQDGSYTITTTNGAGCLDVYGGSIANGTLVTTWACHGSNNENFLLAGFQPATGLQTSTTTTTAPTISPNAGSYTFPLTVTIAPAIAGTPIHYTTDNSTPTSSSVLYSGPLVLSSIATVRAIAIASGSSASNIVSSTFTELQALPVIFNVSSNVQSGDIISIQGTNFDATSQVWLGGAGGSSALQLTLVNRVGTQWIAAQTPQNWTGAMVLWVSNSSGASNSVNLNGAIPLNLDALELIPGGAFRVLGRNLLMPGSTPVVMVDGQRATVNVGASSTNMLVAVAPSSIGPSSGAAITVDNGNGTGPASLIRPIAVATGSGDPFGLGVGWAGEFSFYKRVIAVNTPCNGSQDDSGNIQSAINSAADGGGVVQLPVGKCVLANSLNMQSNVVLQGAGTNSTFLEYESNYPIFAQGNNLVGLRNFTLVNADSTVEGLLWKQNTRSFFQNISIQMGVSHQLYLTGNQNFIVTGTDFVQGGSVGGQNPYLFSDCSGFVFSNNTSIAVDGSPTFQSVHDALIASNHFTRNAVNQYESIIIATHGFVMDFAYRMAIVGNTFDVTNGPITNTNRNDGETLLTEGGGGNRTENEGTVGSATAETITDPNNTINVDPFGTGLPENYGVAIVSGTGAGQTREVVGYSNSTLQVDHAWDVIPDTTSHYATFVWGLEKTLIEGNTLIGQPRGIWIYQAATREVDISNNTITNGGGVFLRSEEQMFEGTKQFDPMYDVRIEGNTISNSDGIWMSYLNVIFVNADQQPFGTADTGIEIRNNSLTANNPNVTSTTEDRNVKEGFMNLMASEASDGVLTGTPMILGTIFQGDQCLNCSTAFVIGTGAYGTVLANNQPPTTSPNFLADWQMLGPQNPGSIGTVIQ